MKETENLDDTKESTSFNFIKDSKNTLFYIV